MAKFNITVAQQVVTPYTLANRNITIESCTTETNAYTVQLYKSNPEIPVIDTVFLLETYTGVAWKTLTISNIVYSHSNDLYLEYQSVPLNINTVYNIDVSLLSPGNDIPDLLVKSNVIAGSLIAKNITYDITITDINDVTWGTVVSDVDIVLTSCLTPVEPTVTAITSIASPPTQTIYFTVTSAPFSNVNFQYIVRDKSTGGFLGRLVKLVSSQGAEVTKISSISQTLDTTFNIITTLDASGVIYLKLFIETKPPSPAGPESDSFTDVDFLIRNNANTSTIQTLDIWIGETTVP